MRSSDVFSNFSPTALTRAARVGRFLGRHWFRYRFDGLEQLPDGPCLVVGNHSGFGIIEELMFATVWHDNFEGRRAWGLIHDAFIGLPVLGRYYGAIGAIPASPANARAALARGDVVLVFPGGDLDCCRPFHEADRVNFGARRGYVRLAREAHVPVLPLATIGSHWTWTFLPGGRFLASIPWVCRTFRTDCVPIPTALVVFLLAVAIAAVGIDPWWTVAVVGLLGIIPTPVKIHSELGPPMRLDGLDDEEGHALVWGWLQERVAGQPSIVSMTSEKRVLNESKSSTE